MRYFIVPNNLESDDCCRVRKVIKKERERNYRVRDRPQHTAKLERKRYTDCTVGWVNFQFQIFDTN